MDWMQNAQSLVSRAQSDPSFLERFKSDPMSCIREVGINLPPGSEGMLAQSLNQAGPIGQQLGQALQQHAPQMGGMGSLFGKEGGPKMPGQ
ncbi:MAG: hypothetical protein ACYC4L_06380 [Chloroflexota bacterium]